jgi:hypothetical protein
MSLRCLACVAFSWSLTAGCGQALKPIQTVPSPDGGIGGLASDGGSGSVDGGSKALAVVDMNGVNQPGSPTVVITAPSDGQEVAGDTLSVTATITSPTSTLIAAGSVAVVITPPGGTVVSAPLYLTAVANVYAGDIDISTIPSGPATFDVTAADIAGRRGSAGRAYVHDHGPTLTFVKPAAATVKGSVTVEIIVDDSLHPITDVAQVQAGIRAPGDIALAAIAGAVPFRVAATVDVTAYNPPLDGPQIINAKATNDHGTVGKAQKQFIVDNRGPGIVINNPTAGSFVGGVLTISADVKDDYSPVNESTVVAVFGGNAANSVALQRTGGNTFTGTFDVRALGIHYVLPELSVRADDVLGNHSELAEEIVVDNTRPWMTMNAAIPIRVSTLDSNNLLKCSQLFSPLGPTFDRGNGNGPEVAFEGATVPQILGLRARIEDRGNTAPGLDVERYSGILPTSVTLFVLSYAAGNQPLAVDTDGDGACDDINPTLIPTTDITMSGEALALAMAPMNTEGTPDYRFDATRTPTTLGGSCTGGTAGCPPAGCSYVGDPNVHVVPPLCQHGGTSTTFVIPYRDPSGNRPIWTIAPVDSDPDCIGLQLDALNHVPEGPACAVTRATDNAGNTNVSFPIHICIDLGGGLCNNFTPVASDCTGVWDKAKQAIVAGTCHAGASFSTDGKEVRYLPAFE